MEKEIRILFNRMTPEDYGQMMKDGFRPGELTPAENVFLLDEVKDSLRATAGGEYPYAENLSREERRSIIADALAESSSTEDECLERELTRAFRDRGLPLTQDLYEQGAGLLLRILALENISDGTSEYVIRNGVNPTIENLYRLRFEKESGKGADFERSDSALAWSFPEEELFDLKAYLEAEELLWEGAELQAGWLREHNLFLTAGNMMLLNSLWGLPCPFEVAKAAEIAADNLSMGYQPETAVFDMDFMNNRVAGRGALNAPKLGTVQKSGQQAEKSYRKGNLKERESDADYAELKENLTFEEFREAYKDCDEALTVLQNLGIRVCANHLLAMKVLLAGEGEKVFARLSEILGTKELIACFHEGDGKLRLKAAAYRDVYELLKGKASVNVLQTANEGKETSPAAEASKKDISQIARILLLMRNLAEKGSFEIPVSLGEALLCIHIRKQDGNIFVSFRQEETGGIFMNIRNESDGIHALVVGDDEEALESLKESGLLSKYLLQSFKKEVRCTYLFREMLPERNLY